VNRTQLFARKLLLLPKASGRKASPSYARALPPIVPWALLDELR
jgi:hypothetical protein